MPEQISTFDPHTVQVHQHSRGCAMEFEGYVDELDYKTLLLLYGDARKYASLEANSRNYWSARCSVLTAVLQRFLDDGYNREHAEWALAMKTPDEIGGGK